MSAAPKTYAQGCADLIRMLASNHDGERNNALMLLDRKLKGAGPDFNVLAGAVEWLNDDLDINAEMNRVYEAGRAAAPKAEEPPSLDFNTFRDIDGKLTWQTMALYCQQRSDRLKQDNHKEFVADMAARTSNDNFGRGISPKQLSYLQSLYFKLGGKP
jgi:hypothetical protein